MPSALPRVIQRAIDAAPPPVPPARDYGFQVLLPVPENASRNAVAAWIFDAVGQLAEAGATFIPGSVMLLIELPQHLLSGDPNAVKRAVTLVKAILVREGMIEGEHALADTCIRVGPRLGIFVSLQPFRAAA